jgi:hypothetical protein
MSQRNLFCDWAIASGNAQIHNLMVEVKTRVTRGQKKCISVVHQEPTDTSDTWNVIE